MQLVSLVWTKEKNTIYEYKTYHTTEELTPTLIGTETDKSRDLEAIAVE